VRRLFAITSVLFLGILLVAPIKNAARPYRALQRRYADLGASRAKSLKAAREYESRSVKIQQIWLRDLEDRVDRCITCHLGVADPVMDRAPEPFRLHTATAHTPDGFDNLGCTSCHGGQGLATSEPEAHGTAKEAGPPMTPLAYVEAGCGRCHEEESVAGAPLLSRGRALMARSGCTSCHLVRGHEKDRSEAPPLATVPVKTGALWLAAWLKDPKSVDPNATMPNFGLAPKEIEELSSYLFAQKVPEALAAKVGAADAEPAGDAKNGKKLVSESRCVTCHTVEGKGNGSAPELSHVATRATRGWLLAFLRDPHAFSPRTRMPRYGFTDVEARDVVAFMEDEWRDFDAPKGILEPLRPNQTLAEKGAALFRQRGCFACHGTEEPKGPERFGPELDGVGDKRSTSLDFGRRTDLPRTLPAWLAAKVRAPRSFADGLKMPTFAFSDDDTRAVVTALLALGAQPVPERYRHAEAARPALLPAGRAGSLVERYRCLSCHRIGDAGRDVSTAPLTFEGSKVQRAWLASYLVLSYTIRPALEERMPVLRMPREEAEVLADTLETFYVDPAIPEDPFAGRPASDADASEGQRLTVALGCRGCHILGGGGGYVGPPLDEAGARLKPGWIYSWMKGPQRWRADVRCPNYGLGDTDALRIAAYVGSLKGKK
jgi:cytochrome c2